MAHQSLIQEYMQTPVVTRAYTTACVLTTLAVQLEIVSPFQLYFNPILIVKQYQICAFFVNLLFLGQAFTIMLVYVWSRRNPLIRMNFFGLLNFQAPYLPWVLLGFSVLLGNTVLVDLMGMAVGHTYYVMEDVFPLQRGGIRILKTPQFLKRLFDPPVEERGYSPLPEEQPGGFDWQGDAPNQN